MNQDPIGLWGGENLYWFAFNAGLWIDPFGLAFFRGSKNGIPDFTPKPNEYKVKNGLIQPTHGVSVFNDPNEVTCRGFTAHKVDESSVPDTLKIQQRGQNKKHFEIMLESQ